MIHQIRTSMLVGITLLMLFFGSWILTSVVLGNAIKVEFYDTLESQLAEHEYTGFHSAFTVGILLELVVGFNILVIPLMGWSRWTQALFALSAVTLLVIGVAAGTKPYTFNFGIVEKDTYTKPPIPLRGLMIYGVMVLGGIFSFIFLWLDNKNKSASAEVQTAQDSAA
jgi:hypothetical protein